MREQNYKNHGKLTPWFHIVLLSLILAVLVISIMNLVQFFRTQNTTWHVPVLLVIIATAMLIHALLTRFFATKLQDRAIRAEENLRYFSLTGKLFDDKVTMAQIIALRFAPNDELFSLVDRAIKEGLSKKQIKQEIKNWRADNHRV